MMVVDEQQEAEKRRATIRDVARESGVALSTVSNALTGKGYVSPETRLRIREVAERLDYRASPVARGLRMRRSFTIGVLTADIANPAFPAFIRGIEDVAVRENCTLLLCNTDGLLERQMEQMRVLLDRQVDGIVLISQFCDGPELRALMDGDTPIVLLQRRSPAHPDDYVGADNFTGIDQAVRHLVDHGHRRIGFIRGPAESSTAHERLDAFGAAVSRYGLDPDAELVFPGDYSIESGLAAGTRFLGMAHRPTAIMASNDLNALGVMDAATRLGVAIPTDLSLVGFDDIALASLSPISLTTIRLTKREMGAAAAELLLKRVDAGRADAPVTIIMPTELIIRGSTGPVGTVAEPASGPRSARPRKTSAPRKTGPRNI